MKPIRACVSGRSILHVVSPHGDWVVVSFIRIELPLPTLHGQWGICGEFVSMGAELGRRDYSGARTRWSGRCKAEARARSCLCWRRAQEHATAGACRELRPKRVTRLGAAFCPPPAVSYSLFPTMPLAALPSRTEQAKRRAELGCGMGSGAGSGTGSRAGSGAGRVWKPECMC